MEYKRWHYSLKFGLCNICILHWCYDLASYVTCFYAYLRGTSTLNILSQQLISKIHVENIQRLVRRLICLFTVNLGFWIFRLIFVFDKCSNTADELLWHQGVTVVLADCALGLLPGGLIYGSVGSFLNNRLCPKIFCISSENEAGEDKGLRREKVILFEDFDVVCGRNVEDIRATKGTLSSEPCSPGTLLAWCHLRLSQA